MSGGNLTSAYLIINISKNNLVSVDLMSSGPSSTPQYIGLLNAIGNAGSEWSVNLNITLTNFGTGARYDRAPSIDDPTAKIQLIYSKTNETPP